MPGIPFVTRETTNFLCNCPRNTDQMCRQDSLVNLSPEEEAAVEQSLSVYCKPVELYNILQRRAVTSPSFLQRCLGYKIQAKHKKRIQVTVALTSLLSDGLQTQSSYPIHILLARPVSNLPVSEYSAVYRFKRSCILPSPAGTEGMKRAQTNFILPETNKLEAEASLVILIVSGAAFTYPFGATQSTNVEGVCLLGTISMELLYLSLEKTPNLNLGERAEMMTTIDMRSHFIKLNDTDPCNFIAVQLPNNSGDVNMSRQVEALISAEEVGAKERSVYDSYAYHDSPSSLSHIRRLRTGNVMFNYKYYNNQLKRTEVTEDFSCPFCLVKCASFKGLRYHLPSSHDLFNFDFWVSPDYQVVNMSVKSDIWRPEIVKDDLDPKQQTFFYCSKRLRRRKPKSLVRNASHVHQLVLNSDTPIAISEDPSKTEDPEFSPSGPENNDEAPGMLQSAKKRKLSAERSDHKNRALLQKRRFFHSHRAQVSALGKSGGLTEKMTQSEIEKKEIDGDDNGTPMEMEQIFSDRDSEDEVDDDVAEFVDRRMLDDFVDVTKDEKQIMHLWNSFVRKQRVLLDGHISWACDAFTKLHARDLIQAPSMLQCWRFFMVKQWNHGLLDGLTMNNCNKTLEQCQNENQNQSQNQNPDPMVD